MVVVGRGGRSVWLGRVLGSALFSALFCLFAFGSLFLEVGADFIIVIEIEEFADGVLGIVGGTRVAGGVNLYQLVFRIEERLELCLGDVVAELLATGGVGVFFFLRSIGG